MFRLSSSRLFSAFNWSFVKVNVRAVADAWSAPYQLRVFTMTGQLIHEQTIEAISIQVDLGNFVPGTYFVDVSDGTNRGVEKFIVH